MKITNSESNTNIAEIGDGIYRISTPVPPNPALPSGFTFNQFLIVDDEPLLFHTGLRGLFPLVREAIETVIPVNSLRYLGVSHFEADECGALNEFLDVAPHAVPLCSAVAKMVSVDDVADREAVGLSDGEQLPLGQRTLTWVATPHLPHGWDCGYLFDQQTSTLFCGDLFTQPGADHAPLVESDILGPSEAMRKALDDYFASTKNTSDLIAKLAAHKPTTLACMHGSSWQGNGSELLGRLAASLG
jgi:flavorubredoxin